MKKILAMGASTSSQSINRTLARFAVDQLESAERIDVDLNDYDMPLYSVDREGAEGIPESALRLVTLVESVDGIVLSLAEHNGSYAAAFKNIVDWGTRHKKEFWSGKPMVLLSTSPGARGGATVLEAAKTTFPFLGANVVGAFSLPSFGDSFSQKEGITDPDLKAGLMQALAGLTA